MNLITRPWDAADYLETPEAIAAYLEAAMEDGDPALITAALGDIARARGMTSVAKDAGLSREALYRALSADGRPEFVSIVKVLRNFLDCASRRYPQIKSADHPAAIGRRRVTTSPAWRRRARSCHGAGARPPRQG